MRKKNIFLYYKNQIQVMFHVILEAKEKIIASVILFYTLNLISLFYFYLIWKRKYISVIAYLHKCI